MPEDYGANIRGTKTRRVKRKKKKKAYGKKYKDTRAASMAFVERIIRGGASAEADAIAKSYRVGVED